MSEKAEKLKSELLALSELEQLEIADFIYANLPPPPGVLSEGDPVFDSILARRLEELKSGRVVGVPADQVMSRLREKYAR